MCESLVNLAIVLCIANVGIVFYLVTHVHLIKVLQERACLPGTARVDVANAA